MPNEYDEILTEQNAPTNNAPTNEYDALLVNDKSQQRDVLNQSMAVATQVDPDKRAKSIQLSQQMNLPPEFVEKNYDELSKNFKVQSLPYERIISEAPGTAKFMENPDNAAIAHDDIDNLTQIERGIKIVTSKRGRDSIYSLPSELVNAGKTSLNNLGATAEHVRYAYGLADDSALENIAEFNRRAREATNKSPDYAKEFAKMAEKESGDINKAFNTFLNGYSDLRRGNILQALIDFKKGLHQTPLEALDLVAKSAYRARGLLYSSVEQIANAAPGILGTWAGAAAPVPLPAKPFTMFAGGFLGSGISEVGSQINEQLEKRGYDVTDAASLKKAYSDPALMAEIRGMAERKGITTGAVDALFNMFAGGFSKNLTKGAGMAQKAAAAAADVGVQAVGETAGEFGGQVAREKGDLRKVDLGESIQEGILSLGHGPMEVVKGMRDVPVVSDAQTDTVRASADAGVPPGGAAPAGASMRANLHPDPVKAAEQLAISANQAIEAQEGAQALAEIATVLAQSKVEQRVPGKVAELIELAGGPDAHVFYQTDNWDSIWSKKGISPIKAAEALMGDGGKAYHEAKQGSGMLAFPLSQFVTKAGKDENFQEILEEARLKSPGNPSLKEALEIMKQLPVTLQELSNEAVKQAAEEAANEKFPDADKSAKEVGETIAGQLREQGVDASQAVIHERVFATLGKRLGVAPMELFNRYKLSVEQARGKAGRTLEQSNLPAMQGQKLPALPNGVEISPLGFFSPLEKAVVEMQGKAFPAKDLLGRLKNTPGIKADELEFTGFQQWLEAVAALAGTPPNPSKWITLDKSETKDIGILFDTKQAAEAWVTQAVAEKIYGEGQLEVREQPDATNRTGKVTKEEALEFLKQGGLQVEQVVLGEDFVNEDNDDSDLVSARNLEWGEVDWDEPDSDMVSEEAGSQHENEFDELERILKKDEYKNLPLNDPKIIKELEKNWYRADEYAEIVDELREATKDKYTDDEGKVDEVGLRKEMLDDLSDALWQKLDDYYYEVAREYLSDPDNGQMYGTITESNTEWYLYGNGDSGWTLHDDRGRSKVHDLSGSEEEAQVRAVQYMLAEGVIHGSLADVISPEDISWLPPEVVSTEPMYAVVKKSSYGNGIHEHESFHSKEEAEAEAEKENKDLAETDPPQQKYYVEERVEELTGKSTEMVRKNVDKFLSDNKDRFDKEAREYYDYDKPETEEEKKLFEERVGRKAKQLASQELAEAAANEPENHKRISLSHDLIKGEIVGSRAGGYTFTILAPKRSKATFQLGSETVETAKMEALKHLQDKKLVGGGPEEKTQEEEGDAATDINAPTGETKWDRYTEPGGTNYREFLLRLPQIALKFYKKSHFSDSNILAHVRVKDRVDENGKKILFIEELQSDWHQEGRKHGYDSDLKALQAEVAELRKKTASGQLDGFYTTELERLAAIEADAGDPEKIKINERIKELDDQLDEMSNAGSIPDAPLKNTDAWSALAMKRMMRLASEQGYDGIAWTKAAVHVERWGTEHIGWVKKDGAFQIFAPAGTIPEATYYSREEAEKALDTDFAANRAAYTIKEIGPHWLVGSIEQLGGMVDGMNVEEAARAQGKLLEDRGRVVTSEKELKEVIDRTLSRDRGAMSVRSLTKSVWKQMQDKPISERKPRKEGMEFFYDNLLPTKVVPAILKKLDKNAKVTPSKMLFDGEEKDVWKFDLTAEAKKKIEEGQTYFQSGPQGPRGFINLLDHEAVMKLTAAKDPSTFFHESGHYYFEVMSRLAADETAPQQIKDDFQEMLRFSGYETVENMRSALDEIAAINAAVQAEGRKPTKAEEARLKVLSAPHEKWADAFMKYIMEGKAPSLALKRAFAKFKVWLISVYRELRNIQVELTPEIRGVMDRLFATDEEIKEATEAMGIEPIFFDAEKAGMSEAQHLRYQQAQADATSSAEEELTAKLMKDFKREQTAQWEGEKNQLKDQIELQVNADPAYKAYSILTKGTLPDGTKVEPIKLDVAILRDKKLFSADMVSKLPKGITSKEGGMHPDEAADHFGFASGNDLLKALVQAHTIKKDALVDNLAQEAMIQKHGDLLKSEKLPDEAIKALHNDKRADLLRMELEHMLENNPQVVKDATKKLIRRMPPKKETREQAQKIIVTNPLGTLKPYMYQRAEIKAAKQAADAWGKGDWGAAFDFKLKELLNHELYRASVEALDTMEKANEKFKKITRGKDEDLARTRNMDLVNAARAVLAQFGIGRADKSAMDYLKDMARYDADTYETIKALVDSATERVGPLESITYDDFIAMKTAVDALWQLSKSHKEMEIDGRKVDRKQAIERLKVGLSKWKKDSKGTEFNSVPGEKERNKMMIIGTRASWRMVEAWVSQMDMGPKGEFRDILWNRISESADKYRAAQIVKRRKVMNILRAHAKGFTQAKIAAPELIGANGKPFVFANKSQLLHALLHTGNASNKEKLLLGYGWGQKNEDGTVDSSKWNAFMNRLIKEGVITKADMDFAQAMWDEFEALKPEAQRVHKQIYGHYFNDITAEEIDTPWGKYRGGYIPATADPMQVEDAAIRNDRNALEGESASLKFPTTGRGFTKSRVEGYNAPLQLDLRSLPFAMDWTLRFIHLEPAVKEVGRIVNDKEFRGALAEVNPTTAQDMLIPWLKRAATQSVGIRPENWSGKASQRFWAGARKRSAMMALAGNFVNGAQQLTGLAPAMIKVGPRYMFPALWRYIRNPMAMTAAVRELSQPMAIRQDSDIQEMQKVMDDIMLNPTKYQDFKAFSEKHQSYFSSLFQGITDTVTYMARHDQAVAAGESDVDADRLSLSAVRETQGSRNPEDISAFQARSEFVKAFSMFFGYFNTLANTNETEVRNVLNEVGLRKGAGRLAYIYVMGFMAPAVLAELITRAFSGKGIDSDDDDEYLDEVIDIFFWSQPRFAAAMIPVFGQAAMSIANRFNNKWYDDRISTSPVVSMWESAANSVVSVPRAFTDPKHSKRAVQDVMTAIGLASGLPTPIISRPLGYAVDVMAGQVTPSGPIDFTRGMLTGKGDRKK